MTENQKEALKSGAKFVTAVLEEDPLAAVGHALDAAIALAPVEDMAPYLTDIGIIRAKLVKAITDRAKFGPIGA